MQKQLYPLFVLAAFMLFVAGGRSQRQAAVGPGIGNLTYQQSELFKPIGVFNAQNGAPLGHGHVTTHKGYVVMILANDSGNKGGGFAFFDMSDPRNPQLVNSKIDSVTEGIREGHGYGYTKMNGRDYVALQSVEGYQIWDWTDVMNPLLVADVDLPGVIEDDYALGAWWIHWQAPYIYLGASSNGLFIIDASNPLAPVTAKHLPPAQTGGFRIGPLFAIGNLLVLTSMDAIGMSTMDISDPVNPTLIDNFSDLYLLYSSMMNGNYIIGAGADRRVHLFDISDPANINHVSSSDFVSGGGGYANYQDGFIHAGMSEDYYKFDMTNPNDITIVGSGNSNIPNSDYDFASVLGNLAVISNDHGTGSGVLVHQTQPDLTPPIVTRVIPAPDATNLAVTSRIGITMSDLIDFETVNEQTFIVRPLGGQAVEGIYSHQFAIINFSPSLPLDLNTTYEVVLPVGGMKDVMGNAVAQPFTSRFTTGSSFSQFFCSLTEAPFVELGLASTFNAETFNGTGTVTYTWNYGDGVTSAASNNPFTSHVYQNAGRYTVIVTVHDGASQSSCTIQHTVYAAVTTTKPAQASTILLDKTGEYLFNVNPDNHSIGKINARTLEFVKEINVGEKPVSLAQDANENIWMTLKEEAAVHVYDKALNAEVAAYELPHGSMPSAIVFSPDKSAAYVSLYAMGEVVKLNVNDGSIAARMQVGSFPKGLAVSRDNNDLYVTRFITVGDSAEVIQLKAQTLEIVKRIKLGPDFTADSEFGGKGKPNYLNSITLTPDGRYALVPAKKDNIFRGLQRDGNKLNFENTVRPLVSKIDLLSGEENVEARIDINNGDVPTFVITSKYGNLLFVALQGNDRVDVFDAYSGSFLTSIMQAGIAPQGLTLSRTGDTLFVHSFLSRTVSAFNINQIVNQTSSEVVKIKEISTIETETMDAIILKGKKIFHNAQNLRMSKDAYMSCATCHHDGEHDGQVFDLTQLGEGLRNTIPLNGRAATKHGNVHWTGNFDELQDFEGQIRELSGGKGFMNDADFHWGTHDFALGDKKEGLSDDLDALAAYVASLGKFGASPYRAEDRTLTDAGERGKQIFAQLECGLCHAGNDFTDSEAGLFHDIGTIDSFTGTRLKKPILGFDIPTLKGLWLSEPYLHDGSANTLHEALTATDGTLHHADVNQLTQQQLDDLVAYLLQIDDDETGNTPFVDLQLVSPEKFAVLQAGKKFEIKLKTDLQQITDIRYYVDGSEIASTTNKDETIKYSFPVAGNYNIQAKVYHHNGKLASVTADNSVTVLNDDCDIEFTYSPNPVANELRISLDGIHNSRLRIFDAKGTLFFDEFIQGSSRMLDLSVLQRGVYLLTIEKDGCRVTKRVVRM